MSPLDIMSWLLDNISWLLSGTHNQMSSLDIASGLVIHSFILAVSFTGIVIFVRLLFCARQLIDSIRRHDTINCNLLNFKRKNDWSSWATPLTTVGGLLGIVLVVHNDNATFGDLSLFFGALVLIAPLIYMIFQPQKTANTKTANANERQNIWHVSLHLLSTLGKGAGVILANILTLWAVVGELAATWFLLAKLTSLPLLVIHLFQLILMLAVVLAFIYDWQTISTAWQINSQTRKGLLTITDKQAA